MYEHGPCVQNTRTIYNVALSFLIAKTKLTRENSGHMPAGEKKIIRYESKNVAAKCRTTLQHGGRCSICIMYYSTTSRTYYYLVVCGHNTHPRASQRGLSLPGSKSGFHKTVRL